MQKFHLSSEIQPSEVGDNVFWTNCDDFFDQNHQKMLENSRFWELSDPAGIVFVRRNRLDNYVATIFFSDVKTPSQHPKHRILSNCEDFFGKNH